MSNRLIPIDEVANDLMASIEKATADMTEAERLAFLEELAEWFMGMPMCMGGADAMTLLLVDWVRRLCGESLLLFQATTDVVSYWSRYL